MLLSAHFQSAFGASGPRANRYISIDDPLECECMGTDGLDSLVICGIARA